MSVLLTVFSSHYDVISAPADGWDFDPFTLTGRNGYLYGRGVTDDKGPILATACAAAELLARRALGLDLIFLIEGEEECGSFGFNDAIQRHKVSFEANVASSDERDDAMLGPYWPC
jgi:di- and tripeptidase